MKYTRLEIYKGMSNSKFKVLLGFFIVIPVIAVLAGGLFTKAFIYKERQISFAQEEDKSVITTSTDTKINYKIFSLQAGAFMNKNNADALKNAIKSDDIEPVVIEDANIYRVIISLSEDKELAIEKRDKLQAQGYNCLINEFTFASIDKAENEEIEKTNKLVRTCIDIIKFQLKINDELHQTGTNNSEVLKKYIVNLNDDFTELAKLDSSVVIKTFKSNFEQFINDYIKSSENKDLELCQRITVQQVFMLNDFCKEVIQIIIK